MSPSPRCRVCGQPAEGDAELACSTCSGAVAYWCEKHEQWLSSSSCPDCARSAVRAPVRAPAPVALAPSPPLVVPAPPPIASRIPPVAAARLPLWLSERLEGFVGGFGWLLPGPVPSAVWAVLCAWAMGVEAATLLALLTVSILLLAVRHRATARRLGQATAIVWLIVGVVSGTFTVRQIWKDLRPTRPVKVLPTPERSRQPATSARPRDGREPGGERVGTVSKERRDVPAKVHREPVGVQGPAVASPPHSTVAEDKHVSPATARTHRLLRSARDSFENRRYAEALRTCEDLLRLQPDDREANELCTRIRKAMTVLGISPQ